MKSYKLLFSSLLCLAFASTLYAQDYSEMIQTAANTTMQATVQGDYETIAAYTYPALLEMLDEAGGPDKTAVEFLKETMERMKGNGASIDSGTVGKPTPHVVAGDQLHAIVPTQLFMTMNNMQVNIESFMIAVSSDAGATWTFVNGSSNTEMLLPMLFPEWNDELELPERKNPEIIMDEGGDDSGDSE